MADDLPYTAEYAKSNRSSCKKCKEKITQGILRLAVILQSAKFDGKMTSWYHFDCFFERQRPKSVADIGHFDQLRWEDQERIQKKLEEVIGLGPPTAAKKGKRKGKADLPGVEKHLLDYVVEYAKSGRSGCRDCNEKIAKDEVRISKKSYESERAKMFGPQDEWYHVNCFKNKREQLGLFDSIEGVPGFNSLAPDDKTKLKKEFPALAKKHKVENNGDQVGPSDAKKSKKEEKEAEKIKEETKKQNKLLYKFRDALEQNLTKSELQALLEHNKQDIPSGTENILDLLADIMAFGVLARCPECKNGQLVYRSGVGYVCTGNMSEWTKCLYKTQEPRRKPFKVPKEMAESYSFLNDYKYVERKRIIPPKSPVKELAAPLPSGASSSRVATGPPLKGMTFILGSKLERDKDDIKKNIEALGGKVGTKMTEKVAAVIATKDELGKMGSKMEKAQSLGIQVVSEDIIDEFKADTSNNATFLISKKNMASWGTNVEQRTGAEKTEVKSGIKYSKSLPDKMKLKLKGGGVVDPDSGLEDKAHVLQYKGDSYSVVLGIVDIQSQRNSYYKLQILESDKGNKWWLFRSWGRVGTTIGDNKLTIMDDKQEAIEEFATLYEEKTGNLWKKRHQFVKQPGKLYPLDIDYGEVETTSKMSSENSKSKLPKAVQNLICMLFDIEMMKRAMIEFELDLTKMPLGKISRKQIEKAYGILNQVEQLLRTDIVQQAKFVDLSNQFYTLIPHDFGLKSPPLLNTKELVKSKLEMLESLLEIELAYNLLQTGDTDKSKDPIDSHYEKLNTKIEVLDTKSEEYKLVELYAKNTHAPTHTQYTLDIEEVFKVVRKGESQRYKPFSKLPNKKLLWHGSRVTNMAGILSQGLRIAPPEAPVTGYMFGKGIYFADMVSKSANYCATTKTNPEGLLLLCEVALGNMYERKQADYIEKLKKGYQSTKGVGKTEPDPKEKKVLDNGVEIPCGKPVPANVKETSLLYNEYIVYDVAQVNIKYLIKTKFIYK